MKSALPLPNKVSTTTKSPYKLRKMVTLARDNCKRMDGVLLGVLIKIQYVCSTPGWLKSSRGILLQGIVKTAHELLYATHVAGKVYIVVLFIGGMALHVWHAWMWQLLGRMFFPYFLSFLEAGGYD